MEVSFENLKHIPYILQQAEHISKQLQEIKIMLSPELNLTKPTDVAKYLKVSKPTIYNYINDGTFKEGEHFNRTLNKKHGSIVFVESAIIRFKEHQ